MKKEKNIKKIIETILSNMNVVYDIVEETEDFTTQKKLFKIKSSEPSLLIGENGETFHALSHIIKKIVSKDLVEEEIDFLLDVNDYKSSLVEKLKIKADMLANRARDMKTNVEMEPMSSYERLIVHSALSGQSNIKTESVGEGRERKLIIKYIENN
ncbi:MAG: R3H domain-containing nucleic acid-binding protein [bacterium]